MKLKQILNEILLESSFSTLISLAKAYSTPINRSTTIIKKGHILDNIPSTTKIIMVDSDLFEKEASAWGQTSKNTIAYHDRPVNDKYWNKNLDKKQPPVLVDYYDNTQLRVVDGNHRLTVYLSKGYQKIPTILTTTAKEYLENLEL